MKTILQDEIAELIAERKAIKIRLLEIEVLINSKNNLIAKLNDRIPLQPGQIRVAAEINRHNRTGNVTSRVVKRIPEATKKTKTKVDLSVTILEDGTELIF
jgi:hypothetical protein